MITILSQVVSQTSQVATEQDPTQMLQLLLGLNLLFSVLIGAGTVLTWFNNRGKNDSERTITNDPLTVALEEDFVRKSAFDKLENTVETNRLTAHTEQLSIRKEIKDVQTTLMKAGEDRERSIFHRINETADTAQIRLDDTRVALQAQISAIPGDIVKLLRNTGAIKS